jgi:hypothetical protein
LKALPITKASPVQHQFARLDAVEIDDRHNAAHHHRPLHKPRFFKLVSGHRGIGRAEGHGLGLNLLDPRTRTDRLVVQAVACLFLVEIGPFGKDRKGKGRACAGNIGGMGDRRHKAEHQTESGKERGQFHGCTPVSIPATVLSCGSDGSFRPLI